MKVREIRAAQEAERLSPRGIKVAEKAHALEAKREARFEADARGHGLSPALGRELQTEIERRKPAPRPKRPLLLAVFLFVFPTLKRKPVPPPRSALSLEEVTETYRLINKAPAVIVRQYRQVMVDGASKKFQEDAQILAAHGYWPTTQSFNSVGIVAPGGGFLTVSYARKDTAGQAAS